MLIVITLLEFLQYTSHTHYYLNKWLISYVLLYRKLWWDYLLFCDLNTFRMLFDIYVFSFYIFSYFQILCLKKYSTCLSIKYSYIRFFFSLIWNWKKLRGNTVNRCAVLDDFKHGYDFVYNLHKTFYSHFFPYIYVI